MKTQRRRGFTVVELVVVIAIIAVLAAVLIPTFTSIIKKANDSAYLQERQSQQIADLAEKVEKINYFTWEDFEKKLAEELAKMPSADEASIKSAVQSALEQYEAAHGTGDTGLTKEQVQKIIDEAMKSQLTTAQVEAIVNQAVASVGGGLSASDVQAIVRQALAGVSQTGLNAKQVKDLITQALDGKEFANKAAVEAAIAKALENIDSLTADEVEAIVSQAVSNAIKDAKPAADTVYIAGNMTLSDPNVTYVLRTMNALGTVTLTVPNDVTVKAIIIDAPNVQKVNIVYANNASALKAVQSLTVISTASSSTHVHVKVTEMEINSGRAVIEEGATVTTLTAAPSKNADVTVVVEQSAQVGTLNAEYQDNGTGTNDTIEIINEGTITNPQLTASATLESSGTTTTNVKVTSSADASTGDVKVAESDSAKLEGAVVTVTEDGTATTSKASGTTITKIEGVARIGNVGYPTIQAAIDAAKSGDTVVLMEDVELSTNQTVDGASKYAIGITKSITLDGSGYTVTGKTDRVVGIKGDDSTNLIDVTIKNITLKGSSKSAAQVIMIRDFVNSLTLDNVVADNTASTSGYVQAITVGGNDTSNTRKLIVKNSKILNQPNIYYAVIIFAPTDIEITDSEIEGWSNLYFKLGSAGSSVIINGSKLTSVGRGGASNSFGLINFENGAIGVPVQIKDTDISVSTTASDSKQSIVSFSSWYGPNTSNIVTISGGSVTLSGNNAVFQSDSGAENKLTITNSKINNNGITSTNYSYTSPETTNMVAYMYTTMLNNVETTVCDGYHDFNKLLNNSSSWFCDGEWLEFYSSTINITSDATVGMAELGTFGLIVGNSTINTNGNKVTLAEGVTIKSDKQLTGVFSAPEGYELKETIVTGDDVYKYAYNIELLPQ